MADVEIKGMRELYEALSSLPRKMEPKLLQKALTAGTAVIVRQAKRNAVAGGQFPEKDTGTLQRSIYAKRGKTSTPEKEVRIVNARRGNRASKSGKDAFYARMVEYGHRTAAPGKRLIRETRATTKKGFDRYERKRASGAIKGSQARGFVPAHPFMRPAYDMTKNAATERTVERLRELVAQAVAASRFR